MVRLKILEIDDFIYKLEDEQNKTYTMNLEFFDIDEELKVGDYINISPKLLDIRYEGYSTNYTFGSVDSEYGKKFITPDDIDLIKLEINQKEIFLKRLYG